MLTPQSLFVEPSRRDRITAISGAVQRRPIVLVLGMHRSGTSLCSHLLSALGVDMTDKIAGPGNAALTQDNPRGHWERWEIVEFHDRILGLFNREYLGRFHDFPLPVAWWADPRVVQIRREITGFLEQRMGDGYFGFKDPRTVRLMPIWHQIFNELKLAPKVVLCLRNPVQVARSLKARDGLDPEIGEYRWLVHIVDFFRYANNFDYCTVEYEGWFNDPSANIEKLRKFLDLPWQQSESDLGLVLSGIIDPGARHDDLAHREANQPLVRSLYKLTGRAGQDNEARNQITYIISQFVGFQQLQRPFQQAFEDVAKVAAKYPQIEQEAAGLRVAVSDRNAVVEAANARAAAVEGRLTEAHAEIEQQRAQLAALATARDERVEIERTASGLKASLAERETALAEVSRRIDELGAALQAAQAEVAAHEAALRRAEQEAEERGSAAGVLQAEVRTLREALAAAQRIGEERAVTAEAVRGEIAALWDTLAQAEYEAQEQAAAAEARQAEVGQLRAALAEAERARQEETAAAGAKQAEVGRLREALALGQRTEQEQAVAAEVRQAEIGQMREALAEAERVRHGQTAVAVAMQAELGQLRTAFAEAERARHEQAAAAEAAQAEVGLLREALAAAERARQEEMAAAEARQAEVVRLRDALTRAARADQDRPPAREAMEAGVLSLWDTLAPAEDDVRRGAAEAEELRAEIAELRDMLTRAEQTQLERATAAEALQAEIAELQDRLARAEQIELERAKAVRTLDTQTGALRERLAQAEREARERTAAVAGLHAQIAALQGTLTAARRVGISAIAAVRDGGAMPTMPQRQRGWPLALMRFLWRRDKFLERASGARPAT